MPLKGKAYYFFHVKLNLFDFQINWHFLCNFAFFPTSSYWQDILLSNLNFEYIKDKKNYTFPEEASRGLLTSSVVKFDTNWSQISKSVAGICHHSKSELSQGWQALQIQQSQLFHKNPKLPVLHVLIFRMESVKVGVNSLWENLWHFIFTAGM